MHVVGNLGGFNRTFTSSSLQQPSMKCQMGKSARHKWSMVYLFDTLREVLLAVFAPYKGITSSSLDI